MKRLEPKLANIFAGSPELVKQSAVPPLMVQLHLYRDLDYPQVGPTCVKSIVTIDLHYANLVTILSQL